MTTRAMEPGSGAVEWTQPAPAARSVPAVRRGLSFVDGAVLGLVALVVVLVSLPRLRRFALRENETDAIRALRLLAAEAVAHGDALASGDLGALLASSSDHRVRLEDVEVLKDGRLRCHGYLFAAARTDAGLPVLLAWPWEHGSTGLAAFAIEPGGEPLGLPNMEGVYSGPESPLPPTPAVSAGWIELRRD
jgi:hypothetical protein